MDSGSARLLKVEVGALTALTIDIIKTYFTFVFIFPMKMKVLFYPNNEIN